MPVWATALEILLLWDYRREHVEGRIRRTPKKDIRMMLLLVS